ncbi:hypothetical protein [Streptomyces pseudovenezuelae]|uniref:Nitrogen fixation-related uncharacterized protein n=1 Tax=Streptomyces pseudovenezuelae TaxID=67350 RepID=A0ABT6LFC9_9ACTN|nr:hypothetical protein [Streptomyces pseudovenezuelae]MDH6214316.1 nitrogen fixation-related uncharacterized protein [Streptomyces pseudovenezuelae]
MVVFLLLVLIAVVLGIVGVAADGLGYLLVIGVAVLVAALVLTAVRWSRRSGRRPIR